MVYPLRNRSCVLGNSSGGNTVCSGVGQGDSPSSSQFSFRIMSAVCGSHVAMHSRSVCLAAMPLGLRVLGDDGGVSVSDNSPIPPRMGAIGGVDILQGNFGFDNHSEGDICMSSCAVASVLFWTLSGTVGRAEMDPGVHHAVAFLFCFDSFE